MVSKPLYPNSIWELNKTKWEKGKAGSYKNGGAAQEPNPRNQKTGTQKGSVVEAGQGGKQLTRFIEVQAKELLPQSIWTQ